MPIARRIPKATDTHSEYVTLIAFTLQQRLHEDVTVLRYTYIAWLTSFYTARREELLEVLLHVPKNRGIE
jgi:hypothetical protein